jgi:formamidopyrimidine-DNA glycosylase
VPELPEVETVRRTLEPFVLDRTISRVEVLYPRVLQSISPQEFTLALVGNRFTSLTRRGKYLLFTVSTGLVMVVHLRMTGRLVAMSSSEVPREKHTSAVFTFSAGGSARGKKHPSSQCCWTSARSRDWGTSTPTNRCLLQEFTQCGQPVSSALAKWRDSTTRSEPS